MPRKNNKQNKKQSQAKSQPGINAPLQGVDQKRWVQNDIVPIGTRSPQTFPANSPCVVLIFAGLNGYSWQMLQLSNAVAIAVGTKLYGSDSGQFFGNALLYEEYRVNSIKLSVNVNQGGSLYSFGPMVHAVDPVGQFDQVGNPTNLTNINKLLESMKTAKVTNPYMPCTERYDYNRWIVQTQDTAWLKTQLTNTTTIGRQQYVTNQAGGTTDFRTPGLVFAFTCTASTIVNAAQLGIFEVKTEYVFRQRRLNPSANPLISEEEKARLLCMQGEIMIESSRIPTHQLNPPEPMSFLPGRPVSSTSNAIAMEEPQSIRTQLPPKVVNGDTELQYQQQLVSRPPTAYQQYQVNTQV